MDTLKKRAIEIIASFWLLIVAVQFLCHTPLLPDPGADYKLVYIGMALITAAAAVRMIAEYMNGNREEAEEPAPCSDSQAAVRSSRRSRR